MKLLLSGCLRLLRRLILVESFLSLLGGGFGMAFTRDSTCIGLGGCSGLPVGIVIVEKVMLSVAVASRLMLSRMCCF